jgi:hypothetical protein
MSCCGQKRSAIKQSSHRAPSVPQRAEPAPRSPAPASAPEQMSQLRPSAAVLAYLTRNARRNSKLLP